MCFGFFKLPSLASLASFIRSAYKNNAGTNLIVKAINNAIVLELILIIFNGLRSFSIAVTIFVMVVVKVNIDAIIMNKINFQIVSRPLSNSFLEKNIYIIKINKKMKKNGLKFLINAEKFVFDNMITNNINREKIVNL